MAGFKSAFEDKKSYVNFVVIFVFFLFFILTLQLKSYIVFVFSSGLFSFGYSMFLVAKAYLFFYKGFTAITLFNLILVAVLVAIDLALLLFYLRKRIKSEKVFGRSVFSVLIGVIGVGCSSCGSIILSSFIGISVTSTIFGFLPWHGVEINILSVVILLVSIYLIALKINNPNVCKR